MQQPKKCVWCGKEILSTGETSRVFKKNGKEPCFVCFSCMAKDLQMQFPHRQEFK